MDYCDTLTKYLEEVLFSNISGKVKDVWFDFKTNKYYIDIQFTGDKFSPGEEESIVRALEQKIWEHFHIPEFNLCIRIGYYSSDTYGVLYDGPVKRRFYSPVSSCSDIQLYDGVLTEEKLKDIVESLIVEDLTMKCIGNIRLKELYVESNPRTREVKVVVSVSGPNINGLEDFIHAYLTTELEKLEGRICYQTRIVVVLNYEAIIQPAFLEMQMAFEKHKEDKNMRQIPEIKNLIHSGDYTHIIWEDGTKTSVKREENTPYDAYGAFAQAVLKKLYGSTEKAKFEHTLRQLSAKDQKKVLAEKQARKEKQERAEKKKLDKQLAREEAELKEKEERVKTIREKRQALFKKNNSERCW